MKKHNYILYSMLAGLLMNHVAWSQQPQQIHKQVADTMRRELTIVTDRKLMVDEKPSLPISIMPIQPRTKAFNGSVLKPDENSTVPYELSLGASLTPMAQRFERSSHRGYINLGAGLATHFRGDMGYRILQGRGRNGYERQWDIMARHRSSFAEVDTRIPTINVKSKDAKTWVGTSFAFEEARFQMSGHIHYLNHLYNYHGLEGFDHKSALTSETKAVVHEQGAHLNFTTKKSPERRLYWMVDARLGNWMKDAFLMNEDYSLSERLIVLDADVYKMTSPMWQMGLQGNFSTVFVNSNHGLIRYDDELPNSHYPGVIFHITPYIKFGNGDKDMNWNLWLGGGIAVAEGIYFYPKMNFDAAFGKYWSVEAAVSGGVMRNSLQQMHSEMPYGSALYFYRPTKEKLNARLALRGTFSSALTLNLFGEYAIRERDLFFGTTSSTAQPLLFVPYYLNTRRTTLGSDVSYQWRGVWRADAGMKYHMYQKESYDIGIVNRPTLEFNAGFEVNPMKKLYLHAGYQWLHGRKHYQTHGQEIDLTDLHLLSGTATYRFNPMWSAYANVSFNILKPTERYYGYSYPQNILMLGANFNF